MVDGVGKNRDGTMTRGSRPRLQYVSITVFKIFKNLSLEKNKLFSFSYQRCWPLNILKTEKRVKITIPYHTVFLLILTRDRDRTVTIPWPYSDRDFLNVSDRDLEQYDRPDRSPFLTVPERSWPFLTVHDRFLSFYERLRSFYDLLKTVLFIT